MASSVAAGVTSGGVWKTPNPRAGMSTPLFSISFGWVESMVILRGRSHHQTTDARTEPKRHTGSRPALVHVLERRHREVVRQLHAGRVDRAVAERVLRQV